MGENKNFEKSHCTACMEEIRAGARICPHCHSPQSTQRWKGIGNLLKWVGAITAVISLVVGVRQLNTIYGEWSDRRASIEQFVKAADFQLDLKDYPGAWQIIQECLAVDAMSPKVLKKQVQVAVAWTRDPWRHKQKKKYTEILAPLMPVLFRGAVYDDKQLAADALAHIGYANFLRTIDSDSIYEIDEYFRQSLQKDPSNTYGHLFWGYWILHHSNKIQYQRDRLEIAKQHFSAALETQRDRSYVGDMCLLALSNSRVVGADVETIRVARDLRKSDRIISISAKIGCLELFNEVYLTQFREETFLDRLYKQLSPEDVLATYMWLSRDIDFRFVRPFGMPYENHRFVLGLLKEGKGDFQDALADYVAASTTEGMAETWLKLPSEIAIDRVKAALEKKT